MSSTQNVTIDDRFTRVTKDPRFWEMPEKDKKIKIDKRFRSMFHDKKFNLKYTVDKRGRPIKHNTTEDLKRYYDLSDSDEELANEKTHSKKTGKQKVKTKLKEGEMTKTSKKEIQKEEKDKKDKKKLQVADENNKNYEEQGKKKISGKETKQISKENNKPLKTKMKTDSPSKTPKKPLKAASKITPNQQSEEESGESDEDSGSESICDTADFLDMEAEESEDAGSEDLEECEEEEYGSGEEFEEEEESGSGEDSEEEPGLEELEKESGSREESEEETGSEDLEEESGSGEEEKEDSDSGPDLARGKGNVETSSEDDEEEEDDDMADILHKDLEIEHAWREMDKDAPRGEEITSRLAVCNMDWDRLKAKDLLALFNSFKPKGGVIFSVKVYPSEFGKERLKAEALHGPSELKDVPEVGADEQGVVKEKLREYQFRRLKYYYAVVECDSPETANKIYEECDGLEFESSCSFVDLRFIPDDEQFTDEPKDSATDVELSAYKPKFFTSAAMTTAKIDLTWDETDHDRVTTLNRPFKKTEVLDMDFQAYLASSSDEEEEEDVPEVETTEVTKTKKGQKDEEEQIAKYRELLKSIQDKDKAREDKDMEMEVKWVPGLKENAEQLVKKKLSGIDSLTPWEKYLQKQKDKRKMKKKKKGNVEEDVDEEEDLPSDVDFNDPYFSEEMKKPGLKKNSTSQKDEEVSSSEEAEKEQQRTELSLLMMDDVEEERKHFNYDKIVEQQNLSKKKKKQLKKKQELLEDEFQINVEDTRFQAMYTSHLYNVDPSDSNFKKTKAMAKVLEEKARRREQEQKSRTEAVKKHEKELENYQKKEPSVTKSVDPALSQLLKSVKNKTQQFQASKRQKTK